MNKKEVRIITDPGAINAYSNDIQNNYLNDSIREELKSIQRAISLLRQDLPKIVHDELIRFQNQKRCNI